MPEVFKVQNTQSDRIEYLKEDQKSLYIKRSRKKWKSESGKIRDEASSNGSWGNLAEPRVSNFPLAQQRMMSLRG